MKNSRKKTMAKGRMTENNIPDETKKDNNYKITPLPPFNKGGKSSGRGVHNKMDKFITPSEIALLNIQQVTLGNEGEDDEVNFRNRDDNSFVMFCNGIRDLNEDIRKIKKCDVEEVVYKGAGKYEVYEE
jgi:hypothetical protein